MAWFLKQALTTIFFKRENKDIMAAKEIVEFRNYHLKSSKLGLDKMPTAQMEKELERMKTREES